MHPTRPYIGQGREATLLALVQTNHADFGGTGRTSAARSPDRTARNDTRRHGRHEIAGLITQRSLIQPAQREKTAGSAADPTGVSRATQGPRRLEQAPVISA